MQLSKYSKSKKDGKDQESIQSSTKPDPGYQTKMCKWPLKNIQNKDLNDKM